MRVPVSWLRDYVDLPEDLEPAALSTALIRAGLEVERVDVLGADVSGVVVGEVVSFEAEPQSNGKTTRWCQVSFGKPGDERGIVCGAANFAVGDRVPVALPGAVLPGPFPITARKTYGHLSDGMICSARELGLGDEHSGILVLPPDTELGADVVELFGLRDAVLDIAVTPDRSYCLSVRGVAREAATAYGLALRDPALVEVSAGAGDGYPVTVLDQQGCDRYTVRTVSGIDPTAMSPLWLQSRLIMAGMRPVSLVVDVTNHVMLDLGQPLHAFDRDQLVGAITVRQAEPGERMTTLDGVQRRLDHGELLICDEQGPVALAGVMGGRRAECSASTTSIVLESAHFAPVPVARTARRHKLPSEAARRYERGVDHALAPSAAEVAVQLLVRLAGATADPGFTDVDNRVAGRSIVLDPGYPARLAGRPYESDVVRGRLLDVGCTVSDLPDGLLEVTPPSWRPDLDQPADLAEEIIRLEGYDTVPPLLPRAVAGRGLTPSQRIRRDIGIALAAAGYVETLSYPFTGEAAFDALGFAADDSRRRGSRLLNPISEDEPLLRTTLLPGLLATLVRNVGRGAKDPAIFESGLVFGPSPQSRDGMVWGGGGRPPQEVIDAMNAMLPEQRRHLAVSLVPAAGTEDVKGWWGTGRPPAWAEAIEAARSTAGVVGVVLDVAKGSQAPFHPGRCAVLRVAGRTVGYAGELHPRVIAALDLPPRSAAMEIDLTFLIDKLPAEGPADRVLDITDSVGSTDSITSTDSTEDVTVTDTLSSFPPAARDVAVLVGSDVPAETVRKALIVGAGALLVGCELFDVYEGEPVPPGQRSLAFALRFRATDRTLTDDEVNAARDAALASAAARTGATLRG